MKHHCTKYIYQRAVFVTIIFIVVFIWLLFQKLHWFYETLKSIAIIQNQNIILNTTQFPQKNNYINIKPNGFLVGRDVVMLPDDVLFLIQIQEGIGLPCKEDYECIFEKNTKTSIHAIGFKEPQLIYVRCPYPSVNQSHKNNTKIITLDAIGSNITFDSIAIHSYIVTWENLVYETIIELRSVYLFVKGLQKRISNVHGLQNFHCIFGNMDVVTSVQLIAQEVVRCTKPHSSFHELLKGKKISIQTPRFKLMPSVAYFGDPTFEKAPLATGYKLTKKNYFVCACTMIWNQARFLKEWVMYHSYIGVEHFYLYDNNSEDELEEVISESLTQYNVTHHSWPWYKSQEAGFSHCALRAKLDCDWIIFTDIDEFIYPLKYLMDTKYPSVLQNLITSEIRKVRGSLIGELRLDCHNFGPSGLIHHPEEGVMVGYTCRMRVPQRHKSILRANALNESLLNVVHHFELQWPYRAINLHRQVAVINHYKYQVWSVFKVKFLKRAATYVTNWNKRGNENSRDRVPGLGTEAIEPIDWPDRFCQVVDLGLRNFTLQTFQHPHTHQLLWQ